MRLILFFLFSAITSHLSGQSPVAIQYNNAKEAYEKKDYTGYLLHSAKADSLSPNHPMLTYNLASAHALTGNTEASLELLKKAVLMNTKLFPADASDFDSVRKLPGFDEIATLTDVLDTEIGRSKVAFTISEKDLHPESIAYDPKTGSFYLGSVHKNKIVSYSPKLGEVNDWKMTGEDGLWAVMGMKIDSNNDLLWVCTAATKEMTGFVEDLGGKTALYKYELSSKKLLKRYELVDGHWFGDLILAKDGTPYISDSMKPIIYTVKDDELTMFKDFTGELFNLQGLAFSKDESLLYIADYKLGIQVYNLEKDVVKELAFISPISTKGTDGLYLHENKLISIQNGVFPMRVCQHELSADGSAITKTTYLDRGRQELDEPTLGVLVNHELYYVANSPWGKYDKEGNLLEDLLTENIILKSSLK